MLVAGVVLLVAVIGAYVALALNGLDTGSLFAGLLALLGALGVVGHTQSVTNAQNDKFGEKLGTIEHQTNGQLTKRIRVQSRAAMRDVLREAGFDVREDNATADRALLEEGFDPDPSAPNATGGAS